MGLFVDRPWTRINTAHAGLVYDTNFQVALDVNLARQASVGGELSFHSETVSFELCHFTGFTLDDLDAAGGAFSVAAATVKNVNSRIFNRQNEFLSGRRFSFDQTSSGFSLDLRHLCLSPEMMFLVLGE
jgi:hypothetical protein